MGVKHTQNSFAWGEFDPLLTGRTDIEQYGSAVAAAYNVVTMPQGAFKRAPGLQYIQTVGDPGVAKIFPFELSDTANYIVVIHEDLNMYIYDTDGVLQDTLTHPYLAAEIPDVTIAQNIGELYFFHKSRETRSLIFDTGTAAFVLSSVTFTNIPEFAFEDTDTGTFPGVDHVERIGLTNFSDAATFTLIVNGHETAPITFDQGNDTTTGNNIVAAIEALSNVDANNVTMASLDGSGSDQTFNITMVTNNGSRYWAFEPGKVVYPRSASGGVLETTPVTKGKEPMEPVWSSARGRPRCGAFYKGRLYVGGAKALPNYIWGSRAGEFTDFDTENDRDDMGFAISISGPELPVIHAMSVNRHLQLFGTGAEYYIPEDIDIPTPSNVSVRRTTQRGSKEGVSILNVDGATVFMDKSGRYLREFIYSEAEQAYTTNNLQQLAGHLIESASNMAYRRAQSPYEPDQVFVVDRDTSGDITGNLLIFNTLRDQNIAGWSRRYTYRGDEGNYGAGASGFLDVCVVNGEVFVLTLRDISDDGSADAMFLEKFSDDLELDCALTGGAGATATGLAHLNAAEGIVHVVDNTYQGAATVSGGSCTLGITATEKWQVGYDFPEIQDGPEDSDGNLPRVWVRTLPVPIGLEDGGTLGRKRKSVTVAVRLDTSSHLKVNGKELVRRSTAPVALDQPMPTVTGVRITDGIPMNQGRGDEYEGRIDFTQNAPFPLTVLSIEQTVELG